jgi:hypothetical protein
MAGRGTTDETEYLRARDEQPARRLRHERGPLPPRRGPTPSHFNANVTVA